MPPRGSRNPESGFAVEIEIFCLYRHGMAKVPYDFRQIKAGLEAMLEIINRHKPILRAVQACLVDDATQAGLNLRYLSCQGPTNIISFPEGERGMLSLSLDTYARECMLYGQERKEHFWRLMAHGLAHLAGHDHGAEMDGICALCLQSALEVFAFSEKI